MSTQRPNDPARRVPPVYVASIGRPLLASALLIHVVYLVHLASPCAAEDPAPRASFEAGAAREDITPPAGLPLWGYGARKDIPSQGTHDPLTATAVVMRAAGARLAIVALDLGRSPARETLGRIREEVKAKCGIEHVIIAGSHTHHGPCLELEKESLSGQKPTVEYVAALRGKIVQAIVRANESLRPAKLGTKGEEVTLNRNRHTKIVPKSVDRLLNVVRLKGADDTPIAVLVNFAAHPTTQPAEMLKWSADYPASLRAKVEKELGGLCLFLQGASGDLSADRKGSDTVEFGVKLGEEVVRIAKSISTAMPAAPGLLWRDEEFRFTSRIQLSDPVTYLKYCVAFFKDLVDAYVEEYRDGIRPALSVGLLNGDIGIVAVSGEFFSSHALRLRERARLPCLLFLGYANGYHQYFPTIEAVSEGGYGADPDVSPVEIGAGERMMDRALFDLYDLRRPMR
jgi:hypothetical protein